MAEVWSPIGLTRLIHYTALFAALATPVLILAPWAFATLAVAAAVVYTAAIVGAPALLAPALFLLAGSLVGQIVNLPNKLLLGLSLYIIPMPFLARLPMNYAWVYAVLLAVPIVLSRPRALPPFRLDLPTWSERLTFALLVYVLSLHWLVVLKPEAGADALSMHLAIPANIAANHVMTYEPSRFIWAVMPMGADFAYSIVYLLGGEFAARLLNFAMLLVIEALLYSVVRRWLPRPASFLILALFASSPIVQFATGSLFVENLLAALVLGAMVALWHFGETGSARSLYAAAIMFGAAMATKFGALAFLAAALPFAIFEARRRWKAGLLAAALLIAAAAPPYAVAWWKTGNPLFPFLDPQTQVRDTRFRQPLTWTTLYDLTFHTNRWYEGQDGSFGFQYLLLAPLGLVAMLVAPKRPTASAAVVALGASVFILKTEPNARYLYAALPLLSIPFVSLLAWLRASQRRIYLALLAMAVVCTALNTYFLSASSYYHKDFYGPRELVPFRQAIAYFNQAHPHAAVLLTEDSFAAGLTGDVYENHWHQPSTLRQIQDSKDITQLRSLLERWKVQYFIARKPQPHRNLRPPVLRELMEGCTQPEYEVNGYYVAHLEATCQAPLPVPVTVVGPGTYDDFDGAVQYRGDWIQSNDFDGPTHRTVSYSDDPGAEASLTFEGTGVTWIYTQAPNRGVAAVLIDGVSRGTVNLYSPAIHWQSRSEFGGLDRGRHTLTIRVQSQFVDVDAFEVK